MKKQLLFTLCGTALAALLLTQASSAHHNFAAHYRTDASVTVSGVVTEFRFVNPHARVYLDVRNENGEIEKWMAEGDASVALRRSGWVADELKPGDPIKVEGFPSRSGENLVGWNNITLADGTEIGGGDGRLLEKLRILEESLARYRQQRDS